MHENRAEEVAHERAYQEVGASVRSVPIWKLNVVDATCSGILVCRKAALAVTAL